MKAALFRKYGSPDVLELRDIEKPAPKADEVLIKVRAVSINDWDWGALQGESIVNRLIFGLLKPTKIQILGSDVAGTVEAVGTNVRRFKIGDDVFGDLSGRWGGFAEYVCARETALALKPASMSFEEAAAIPQAGLLAVQALVDTAAIQPGQRLLINGAGGGVGTFAIQIAKHLRATVTAVDSTPKLDLMRTLGADEVLDYTQQDFTKLGRQWDVILDVKTMRSISTMTRVLERGGLYVTVGGSIPRLLQGMLMAKKRLRVVALKLNKDLQYMNELYEAGKVRPVIDGPYPLHELADAFRYFAEARHKGKIVITV